MSADKQKLDAATITLLSEDANQYFGALGECTDKLAKNPKDEDALWDAGRQVKNIISLAKVFGLADVADLAKDIGNLLSTISDEKQVADVVKKITEVKQLFARLDLEASPEKEKPAKNEPEINAAEKKSSKPKKTKTPEKKKSSTKSDADMTAIILEEVGELIEKIELDFTLLEREPKNIDLLNNVFRATHTLKGTAGMGGNEKMRELAHSMENVLDDIRSGDGSLDHEIADVFFHAVDVLKEMYELMEMGAENDLDIDELIESLKQAKLIVGGSATRPKAPASLQTSKPPDSPPIKAQAVKASAPRIDDLPQPEKQKPKVAEQSLRVSLEKLDYLQSFIGELVINKSQLSRVAKDYELQIDDMHLLRNDFNDIFTDLFEYLEIRTPDSEEKKELSGDLKRISSELFENFSRLSLHAERFKEVADTVSFVSGKLQDGILVTRMVPIAILFNKFPRMVRDLSNQNDKPVELFIYGEDTELDKRLIEEVSDALLHLLRNSIDHGIEEASERKAAGKPEEGRIELRAYHAGNNIIIEINDDGAGIPIEKVKDKAIRMGLATAEELTSMDDNQIAKFIFHPGFSTKDEVSELSGRGVGMDVVAQKVGQLKGMVDIETKRGVGVRITLKLPLTLAILQALVVEVGRQRYALPLNLVNETLWVDEKALTSVGGKEAYRVRGSVVSLLRLGELLELDHVSETEEGKTPVVMVGAREKQVGLVVDDLIGRDEFVIKSFNFPLRNIGLFSGATITDDGRAMLILDVPEIIKLGIARSN